LRDHRDQIKSGIGLRGDRPLIEVATCPNGSPFPRYNSIQKSLFFVSCSRWTRELALSLRRTFFYRRLKAPKSVHATIAASKQNFKFLGTQFFL
jgi:hypothetical protein